MAAEVLAAAGGAVTVVEQMPSVGRKLLMAGRGGLNLTHSEPPHRFIERYAEAAPWMARRLAQFDAEALVHWAAGLGIETFVGSSGRVFPRAMKASPLLRAWLRRLGGLGVGLSTSTRWVGWDDIGQPLLENMRDASRRAHRSTVVVMALGGASWPRLGSDGNWTSVLSAAGIDVVALRASNVGVHCSWSEALIARHAGSPLKRIALTVGSRRQLGEAILSSYGLEGGVVYSLGRELRAALDSGPVTIAIDLRPDLGLQRLTAHLFTPRGKQSLANFLRKTAGLPPVAIALLREVQPQLSSLGPAALAGLIKALPISVSGLAPHDRAISTAGGIALSALDDRQMLKALPGVFVAGEMLDWDAPTGGYLLHGAMATGRAAAIGALAWLEEADKNVGITVAERST